MFTMVIADIHGYHGLLLKAIEHFKQLPTSSRLVLLGDYIDRGPESLECLQTIIKLQKEYTDRVFVLKGNHEELFEYYLATGAAYASNGIYQTLCSFLKDTYIPIPQKGQLGQYAAFTKPILNKYPSLVGYIKGLPLTYEDENVFVVHAGVDFDNIECKNTEVLLWSRENYFIQTNTLGKPIVTGHTPIKSLKEYFKDYDIDYIEDSIVYTKDHKYFIDGGVFSFERLNTVTFKDGELYSVNTFE